MPRCRITNIGARDVTEHKPHLILGILWQIIRLLLTAKISLKDHPEMARLLEGDETLAQLLALPPEKILVRWINYHLAAAGEARRISALGKDLADSVVYSVLVCVELESSTTLQFEAFRAVSAVGGV